MKKINLEEILTDVFEPTGQDCTTPRQDLQLAITLNPSLDKIKSAMKEAIKQSLDLASENAHLSYAPEAYADPWRVNKESIINIINLIE